MILLRPFLFAMYLNVYTSNIFNHIQTIPYIYIYYVKAYHLYFDSKPVRTKVRFSKSIYLHCRNPKMQYQSFRQKFQEKVDWFFE